MHSTKKDIPDIIANYMFTKSQEIHKSEKKKNTEQILSDIGVDSVTKEIISTLDYRGERILLPESISKMAKFNEKEEYLISLSDGRVSIKRYP
jgi:hypothetical protein